MKPECQEAGKRFSNIVDPTHNVPQHLVSQKRAPSANGATVVGKQRTLTTFLVKIIQFDDEARGVTSTVLANGPDAHTVGQSVLSTWRPPADYKRDTDDPNVYVFDHNRRSVRLEEVREIAPEHVAILSGYGIEHFGRKEDISGNKSTSEASPRMAPRKSRTDAP
jgi:hypothetical protein